MRKETIERLINYGYFEPAAQMINEYFEENPDDAEILPLVAMVKEKIALLKTAMNEEADPRFFDLMKRVASCSGSEDELFNMILKNFFNSPTVFQLSTVEFFRQFQSICSFIGTLDLENGDFGTFRQRARMLYAHHDDLMRLHSRLADNRSKNVLYGTLAHWVDMNSHPIGEKYRDRVFPHYFDLVVHPPRTDEVFVDIGAMYGDTVLDFTTSRQNLYKHIYSYEVEPDTFEKLEIVCENVPNLTLRPKGAWSSNGTMYLNPRSVGTNVIEEKGETSVETVRIDDDIPEPVTYIKMDIEGAEVEALRGCARQIRENKPNLAICVYHGFDHIWEVPQLIDEIAPGYKFYLRSYADTDFYPLPFEIVLLAVWEV